MLNRPVIAWASGFGATAEREFIAYRCGTKPNTRQKEFSGAHART